MQPKDWAELNAELKNMDFIINHNKNINWKMGKYHFHDFFEINYSLTGDVSFFVGDKIYPAQKGTLFVFNNMDLHRSVSSPDAVYERYVIYFNPDFIRDLCSRQTNLLDCFVNRKPEFSHCIQLSPDQSTRFLDLLERARNLTANNTYGRDVYRKIIFAEILICINSWFCTSMENYSGQERDFEKIRPVIQYIQQHLAEPLSLNHLSGAFYINKYYLCSLFKKATGFTINEYIINRRILKARELLKKKIPVQRVGEMVGFNNHSHFTRTFKGLVGLSPKQYTKKMENGSGDIYIF